MKTAFDPLRRRSLLRNLAGFFPLFVSVTSIHCKIPIAFIYSEPASKGFVDICDRWSSPKIKRPVR